jgi:ERCC4-related helicase
MLQGSTPSAQRRQIWATRRVFYCTPQTISNDLQSGVCPAGSFVCVVIDEAHKAVGNYAYTRVVAAIAGELVPCVVCSGIYKLWCV